MRVAHLSDIHLGFRAYGRVERGADVRERDVARAFERAVREIIRLRPTVIVLAGDVFDRPNPPASAVVALARSLELLRASLPSTPVLMVAGPRDTPRRVADPGALAVLDAFPNVEAATGLMRSVVLERLDLHACLVSYRAATRVPPPLPEANPRTRWNLLVLHARPTERDELGVHVDLADWSYVALGGEHRRRSLGLGAAYPGSLERVELDPWDEAGDEKGFLLVDLERGEASFQPISGRAVAALAPIAVRGGDDEQVRRRVREVTREVPGGIDAKIVRLRLEGARARDVLALQGEQLGELRRRALHLAVEAAPGPRPPAEAWVSVDGPALLREAVAGELERDGLLEEGTPALLARLVPDAGEQNGETNVPVGRLEAVDGRVEGLGRVSTSIPRGLTAVIGGDGRARAALMELLVRSGRGEGDRPLRRFWAGEGGETLDGALMMATEAVAESRGLGLVDQAIARAGPEGLARAVPREPRTGSGGGAVRVDSGLVAAELRAAERELRALRADAAEIDGDLEVATMDWHRERQDAETTLQSYRDQARELRTRIRRLEAVGPEAECPTCGRPLESHYQGVLGELRDTYEGVVQDGSWWRSRWEQLEPKPEHLRELEHRSLQLHAALEAGSERVELLRARLAESGGGVEESAARDEPGERGAVLTALRRVRDARLNRAREILLERASRFVCRLSGGRILAVTWDQRGACLEGDLAPLGPLSEEDLASGLVALRLAAASLVAGRGEVLGSLPVGEVFDRLGAEARIRTVALMRRLLEAVPRIILVTEGDAVDARPEAFDSVLEVRNEAGGAGAALRPVPAGMGRVEVVVEKAATFRASPSS